MEAYQKTVMEQPTRHMIMTSDWNFPLFGSTLFVPEDEDFARDLGNGRMTLLINADGNPTWVEDTWRTQGAKGVDRTFTGATLLEKPDYPLDVEPADPGHWLAQRHRGLPVPTELTDLERCPVCVQAKSRQNQSRTLSLKQPVVQIDFAFVSDAVGGRSITLLNAVDVLTGLGLSVVVPTKGRGTYSQAELRRFILETGRTFCVLQCDPEPARRRLRRRQSLLRCFAHRGETGTRFCWELAGQLVRTVSRAET